MIRKLSAFLILAFIGWGYLQAQEAKTCFKNMPDSICPLLSACLLYTSDAADE